MLNFQQDEKRLFLQGAFVSLKHYGFAPDYEKDPYCDAMRKNYHLWGGDQRMRELKYKYPETFVVDATNDFTKWCSEQRAAAIAQTTKIMVDRKMKIGSLGLDITIPLGQKGQLTFKAGGEIPPDADKDEIMAYYSELFSTAWSGYVAYANSETDFSMAGIKKAYTPQNGDMTETFNMTSIISVSAAGRRDFKIRGDKFPLHGVRVFGEVLIKAGIDPAQIDGEKFITGKVLYTVKATGEPHKVVSIEVGSAQL